jgi:hypothetical protein
MVAAITNTHPYHVRPKFWPNATKFIGLVLGHSPRVQSAGPTASAHTKSIPTLTI